MQLKSRLNNSNYEIKQGLLSSLLIVLLFLSQGFVWLHPHSHQSVTKLLGYRFNLSEYADSVFCIHDTKDIHIDSTDSRSSSEECRSCLTIISGTETDNPQNTDIYIGRLKDSSAVPQSLCISSPICLHSKFRAPPALS